MENEEPFIVTLQFKAILKELLEKLSLLLAKYVHENFGPNYQLSFKFGLHHQLNILTKLIFEDKFGWNEQYDFNVYTKKEAENKDILHVIRYLKCFYKMVINDVNERELYKVKNDLEYLKNSNEILMRSLDVVMPELHVLKTKME